MASSKDADKNIKLVLQGILCRDLTNEEFIECRYSLIKLGKAIAKWHQIQHGKEGV